MMFLRVVIMALITLGTAAAITATSQKAVAQDSQLDAAKAAGVIGEQIDGYIGFVNNGAVDASLQRRVNELNARRRAAYDELAAETGTTPAQVARITGEKQIERALSGQFYMNASGVWVRKP